MSKRINRDDISHLHDYGLHLPSRTVFLETPITDEGEEHGVGYSMTQRVVKNLRLLDAVSDAEITLIINTGGGDCAQGMGIYDAIRACRAPVHGLVVGEASSMGSVILQACDSRSATLNSSVMYHSGTLDGAAGYPFREGKTAVDFEWKLGERIDLLMYERVREKKVGLTFKRFKLEADKGIYCTAEEALLWGLIDHVEGEDE